MTTRSEACSSFVHEESVSGANEESNNYVEESSSTSWSQRVMDSVRRFLHDTEEPTRRRLTVGCALSILALVGYRRRKLLQSLVVSLSKRQAYLGATEAPLSLIYSATREGRVEKALLGATGIFFLSNGIWRKANLPPNSPEVQRQLFQALSATCNDVEALPESIASRLATPVLAALPFVYLAFVYRMLQNMNGKEGGLAKSFSKTSVTTSFRDVAGLDDVVMEVAEVVTFLKAPTEYNRLGARAPRGILLWGKPGGGKTLIAQAVAGEASVDCFLACSASEFVELYVGRGAARVRSLFAQIRQQARAKHLSWWSGLFRAHGRANQRKPTAILFIDELDALAKTRSQWNSNDEREQTLNQLLTEMDGFSTQAADGEDDVTVIVMAASNRADVLDPAILRRFERQIHVGYPDPVGRCSILQTHAKRIQWNNKSVDWETLANDEHTADFSGADIRNLINEAAILAVRESSNVVEQCHLLHAARRIREMKNSLKQSVSPLLSVMR